MGAPAGARSGAAIDVSVLTSGHDVADARLHREVAAMNRAGLAVEVFGLGDPADAPPGVAGVRTWPRPGMPARAGLAVRMAAAARGRVLFTLDPDSALAASVAVHTTRGGRRASGPRGARRRGSRALVVDVHEDFARLLADRAWARRAGGTAGRVAAGMITAFLRVAARADLTVVADEHVPPLTARRRLVLPNLPDPAMLPPASPRDPVPRALYVGDVRATRGLFTMLEAMRAAPDWTLDVVGPVAPGDRTRLDAALAADPKLAARLRWHGRMPPAEAFALARGAWAGLLLLAATPAFADALPSKLHEYLACGLAVVTTDLPRSAALVRESGAGVVVPAWSPGEPEDHVGAAVGAVLRGWSADPVSLDAMRAAATAYAGSGASGASGETGDTGDSGASGETGASGDRAGGYDDLARAVTELARG